ncbi:MAG TPA: sugar phosphate isomerase/epimerase, partial [Chloroflexota bacterium]
MAIPGTPIPPGLTPGIHFAMGGAIFGNLEVAHLALVANQGFHGLEPYRGHVLHWLDRPTELKDQLDHFGMTMVTCSNGGIGQSTEFIDPARRQQTVEDHLTFARDFLAVFGCRHFKINLGARPEGGTSDEDLRSIAATVDEIARRTFDLGITLTPHPHIWGPVERPHEVHRLMEWTDPERVGLIVDTAQINLGGGDPWQMIDTYFERIPAIHWKDSSASYRGYTGPTPTIEQHREKILYKDLGAGGVDHVGIWKLLRERGFAGWVTLDLDPPRPQEGEGSV